MRKIFLFLVLIIGLTTKATEYWVDASSAHNGVGSLADPFNYIFGRTLITSDTFYLKSGTTEVSTVTNKVYINGSNVYIGSYGSADKPILKRTSQTKSPIIHFSTASRNCMIENLHLIGNIEENVLSGNGINFGGEDHIVEGCIIYGFYNGIRCLDFDDRPRGYTINNCIVHYIEEDGMYFQSVDDVTVSNCHLYDINVAWWRGVDAPGDGIQFTDGCQNWNVINNIIDRSTTCGKFCFIAGSAYENNVGGGNLIGNTFYSPKDTIGDKGGCAVYLGNETHVTIARNKFIGRGYWETGRVQSSMAIQLMDRVDIYYNLYDSVGADASIGFNDTINFHNNTIITLNDDEPTITMSGNYNLSVKNNIIGTNGDDPINYVNNPGSTITNNLVYKGTDFDTYFGFNGWDKSDFRLSSDASIAYEEGTDLGYTYDIDSVAVPQGGKPEIGCYEFVEETSGEIPGTVFPLWVTNVTDHSFTANWTSATNAEGYMFYCIAWLAGEYDPTTDIVVMGDIGNVTSFEVSSDNPGKRHAFGVGAYNDFGNGPGGSFPFYLLQASPTADFSANITTISSTDTVIFTSTSTGDSLFYHYQFEGADIIESYEDVDTITYTNVGTYDVSLTVSNTGGSDTETKLNYITVTPLVNEPVADFIANKTSCLENELITFYDRSLGWNYPDYVIGNNSYKPTSYSWAFTNGTPASSSLASPTVKWATAGTYMVQLNVANDAGSDIEEKTGYITVTSGDSPSYIIIWK